MSLDAFFSKKQNKKKRNTQDNEENVFEKKGYKIVEYKCSCKYTIKIRIPSSKKPKIRYCRKCGNIIKPRLKR